MPQWSGVTLNRGSGAPKAVPINLTNYAQWVRVAEITFAQFSTAAATNTLALFSLPTHAVIHGVKQRVNVPFVGLTTYTVSVGDASIVDLYSSAFNVQQAANTFQMSSDFGSESLTAVTQINATAVCTGGNLSAATAGIVDILALLSIAK